MSATSFVGALTGNASTATALATARAINGVNFDGTSAITVTAAAGTLTGTTLNSSVLTSSLTTVGALDAGSITSGFGAINLGADNFTTTGIVSTDTLTLTNTGTLNGLDAIDATGEATLESALDIGGDVTGTGLTAVVIADNAVDGTDIALGSDAQGDLMYYDGTNWVRLAAGNAGEVLQTGGVGANPSWAAAAAGDVTAVGNVASGAAFNGSAGTILTFDDADGDQTFAYDTTNNEFDVSDDVNITGTLVTSGGLTIDATTESNIESAVDIAGDIDGTGLTAVDIDEAAVEAELESVIDLADLQGAVTDGQVPNNITIDSATTAGTVTFADAAGDTTTFVALGTSATGSLAPATDAGLTYNATTDALTATTFVGGLTGNVTGNADTATALASNPTDCGANTFATTIAANGNLTCASLTDADIPNTITVDAATLAGTVTVVDGSDATSFIGIYDSATGSLAPKTDGALTYDATTGALGATALSADTLTLTGTGTLNGLDAIDGTTESTIESALDTLSNVTTVGTLTGGATGAGFTLNFGASTLSGNIGTSNVAGLDVSDDINLTAGDGTVLTGDDVAVDLKTSTENGVGTASSASGLEFESGQLTLLQGCADNEILKWDETDDDWNCEADVTGGGGFDSTTVDSTTWSDGANASNVWTFDVSGTDTTITFGNGIVTFSNDVTVTGVLATSGGLTVDATTESNIETALDTLSNVTTVGALNAGSITSGFGAIDVGADAITTSGTIGTAATTAFTGAGATFTAAVAANGGITFDNSTDTLGAFTAGGTIAMGTQTLSGSTGDINYTNFDVVGSSGNIDVGGTITVGSSDVALTLGTGFIDADSITLFGGGNGVGITTSATGLETEGDGLTLLQGCSDAGILKWEEDTDTWDCSTDSTGSLADADYGDITVSGSGTTWNIDSGAVTTTEILDGTIAAADLDYATEDGAAADGECLQYETSGGGDFKWGSCGGGSIGADSLDFIDLENSLDIDEATDINLGTNAFTIDMDSSGDFAIRDGATDIATFSDAGVITFAPTAGSDFILNMAAGTNFQATATAAPTVDQIALTNAGFGTTTAGVDGLAINFVTGDGSDNTNSALDITLTNGGTAAGDVLRGLTLNNITPTAATETGLYIGTGFDSDIEFADASVTFQLTDRGTLSIVDGTSGVGTLLAVGSTASRGDLDVYGSIVRKGYIDQTAISNVNDVFVYDTARDTDGGAWTNSSKSQVVSWYTESKDDGAGDACNISSDDRCGTSAFPKKAILTATNDALYIFDANSNNLWMKFTQASTGALGADSNNNPSSVFAQNGIIYVGTNGSSGTGMYAFDFPGDKMIRYNTTNAGQADVAISGRNSTVTYNVNSKTNMALNSNLVNDVHATTIQGGSNVLTNGGPLNGVTFAVAATDDGISVVNTAQQVTYDFGRGAITDNYQSVYLTRRGRLFGLNSTDSSVDRFGLITTGNNTVDTAVANVTTASKFFDGATRPASLWKSAPTIATNAPDALEVCEQCSYAEVDTVATGRGDVLYVGHSLGLTEIHDTNGVSAATVQPWSKFYTNAMQTDYMAATNKGMYEFEDTSGDLTDAALTNNVLEPENAPTYGVNGVRGYGLRFDGSADYLCSDVNNDGTCDVETDFRSTTTAFHVSFWFKTNGTVSALQTLVDKTMIAAGTAGSGWRIWLTTTGQVAFGVDDDTSTFPEDTGSSTDDYDDSQWHHVFFQRANAAVGLFLYVDGKLVASDTGVSSTATLETAESMLAVGAKCNSANCATAAEFFNGDMDELVFAMGGATTTDTLNQAQVRKRYLAGLEAMKHKTIAVSDATEVSSTTIGDSNEAWIPNEFVGQIVEITSGTGVGQTRRVSSNTATVLTVSPAWSSTPSTDSDFAIKPEFLYGSSNIVSSVGATTEPFMGRTQSLYVGTDQGSDGGGMTVFGGFGNSFVSDVYHGDSEKTDNSGSEWTGTDYDDMQAIDVRSGILATGSAAATWIEMPDKDVQQELDFLAGNINLIRAELIADGMQASGLEFGAVGSADLAEYYYSNTTLEPGDVVAIQPDQPAGISQSVLPYQTNLLGVVSTQPALTIGASAPNAYAVALAGRIPVKVTNQNGMIHVGDKLTSSSKFGYAMKATKAGAVIGTVLNEPEIMNSCDVPLPENLDEAIGDGPGVVSSDVGEGGLEEDSVNDSQGSDIDEDSDEELCGYAMVFVGLSDSLGENIDKLAQKYVDGEFENLDIGGLETEILADDPIKTEKEIMAFLKATKATYDEDTELQSIFTDKVAAAVEIIAPSVYTEGLTVDSISSFGTAINMMNDVVFFGRPYFNSDTAGFAVIKQGAKKVDIVFTTPYLTQPVISADISLESVEGEVLGDTTIEDAFFNSGINYLVTRKSVNGFTILLNQPATEDIKFSWIALAVNGAITTEGVPTGDEIIPDPVPEPEPLPDPAPEPEIVPEPDVDDQGGIEDGVVEDGSGEEVVVEGEGDNGGDMGSDVSTEGDGGGEDISDGEPSGGDQTSDGGDEGSGSTGETEL